MNDELRDRRDKGWFHIDHALIDAYGPKIGAIGIAVYTYLVHRADRDGVAWPSYKTIADALALSRSTAMREIRQLEHHGLIRIQTVTSAGKRPRNVYTLVTIGVTQEPVAVRNRSLTDTGIKATGITQEPVSQIGSNKNQLKGIEQEPVGERAGARDAEPPARSPPSRRVGNLIALPDPFEISDAMADWVRKQKMPDRWAINRTESFVNHYDNGGKTLLSPEEWTNKWRRWLLDDWAKERTSGLTAAR